MQRWMSIIAISLFATTAVTYGRLVNVTIDDTSGDERTGALPTYTSVHLWNTRAATDGCATCGAQPDGARFVDQTWHDETTYENQTASNVSMSFTGTSIRVFCALANQVNMESTRETHLAFYLDDSAVPVATFDHVPTTDIGFVYNQLVYDSAALPFGEHKVRVSNVATANVGSLILFDYAVYTTEVSDEGGTISSHSTLSGMSTSSPPPTASLSHPSAFSSAIGSNGHDIPPRTSQSNSISRKASYRFSVGVIAGSAVAGCLSALALVCAARWFHMRRIRRRGATRFGIDQPDAALTPYTNAYPAASFRLLRPLSVWKSKIGLSPPAVQTSTSEPLASASIGIHPEPELEMEVAQMRAELDRLRRIADTPPQYRSEASEAPERL